MKKALITGIYGQDGAYLAKLLVEKGYTVFGGSKRSSMDSLYRLRVLGIEDKIELINFDLNDPYNVKDVIAGGLFDEIYNLAAQSFVGASWDMPLQTTDTNAMGPLRILDTIKRRSSKTRFYQASTSEMFGLIQEKVQSETTPFIPDLPMAVQNFCAHCDGELSESFGLYATSGILFNHKSPLRGSEFVTKKFPWAKCHCAWC